MIRDLRPENLLSEPAARDPSALCCHIRIIGLICGNWHAQAGKLMCGSSILAAGSEGTVHTTTVPATSCPERPAQAGLNQEVHQANPRHKEEPAVQQVHTHVQQSFEKQQDKRQKIDQRPPSANYLDQLEGKIQGAAQELAEHPVRIIPGQAGQPKASSGQPEVPAEHQAQEQAEQHIVACLKARLGKQHMDLIRDTMMCQQAVWKEQVGAFHNEVLIASSTLVVHVVQHSLHVLRGLEGYAGMNRVCASMQKAYMTLGDRR